MSRDVLFQGFWLAFAASSLAAYPVYRTLLALKSRQTVSQHAPEGHQKKQGTPTMGGIIILIGILFALIMEGRFSFSDILPHLILLVGFALIGFVDDFVVPRMMAGKRGLGWMQKLAMQVAIAAGAGWTLDASPVGIAVFTLVILFWSNAYNFADGMDLNAGLILLGLCAGFFFLTRSVASAVPGYLPLAMAGAAIPFLFLNAPPAKVFMGDVGALPIGALLGLECWSLIHDPQLGEVSPTMTALAALCIGLVMIIELVPVPIQIFSVKVFKRKVFPYTPIHHAFERAGWPETRVVAMFALAQLLASLAAVSIYYNAVQNGAR